MDNKIEFQGKEYKSTIDLCDHYGVSASAYALRRAKGFTMEEALISKRKNISAKFIYYNEIWYESLEKFCEKFNIEFGGAYARTKGTYKPSKRFENLIEGSDIRGTGLMFNSVSEVCRHYKVSRTTYISRRELGLSLEEALLSKRYSRKNKPEIN